MKTIVAGVIVLAGLVIAAFAVSPTDKAVEPTSGGQPVEQVESEPKEESENTKESAKAEAEERYVYFQMTTSMGEIYLELDSEKAPISTQNFLAYTEAGHYDGTIFHRVISSFMIQGGAFLPDMNKKPMFDPIENEWTNGLSNVRGSIAMARLGGRANSATAQFFINVQDNKGLDRPNDGSGYAVFGKVVRGMDIVDKIRVVPTGRVQGYADVPRTPVVIEKVVQLTGEQVEELDFAEAED